MDDVVYHDPVSSTGGLDVKASPGKPTYMCWARRLVVFLVTVRMLMHVAYSDATWSHKMARVVLESALVLLTLYATTCYMSGGCYLLAMLAVCSMIVLQLLKIKQEHALRKLSFSFGKAKKK